MLAAGVALAAGGVYGVLAHQAAVHSRATLVEDIDDFKTAVKVQDQLGQLHASVYRTLAILNSLDDHQTKAFAEQLAQRIAQAQLSAASMVDDAATDASLKQAVAAAVPLFDRYRQLAGKAIEMAVVDTNMGVAAMHAAEKTYVELGLAMGRIVTRIGALNDEHAAAASAREAQLAVLLGMLALLATGAALAWASLGQRRIVGEIAAAVHLSEEVARGNLAVVLQSARTDEVGDLVRSLGSMVTRLRESLQTVREASSSIGCASVEFASGNLDLSRRTEQTAASLQLTTGAMSQLTGAVRQSADAAAQANQLAASASQVAQRGGEVVTQVVATMHDINISSHKIADIVGTINGIAFQTNILALNAAVEAARAGEQGRGFAVVASEVRSLAARSAEAAREIKNLIGASVEKVESGSRLVGSAGATMTEIVASVRRVSDIIGEISAAAGEQSQGIGKVNQSVNQLDQMTQQNAALVQQSAAAAESLKAQAISLEQVVGRFDVGQAQATEIAPQALTGATMTHARARADASLRPVNKGNGEWTSF